MRGLTTDQALAIVGFARQAARVLGAKPLGSAVVDAGGHLLALARDEDAGFLRATIAANKAWGCVALGMSGGELTEAIQHPRPRAGARSARRGGCPAGRAAGYWRAPSRDPRM